MNENILLSVKNLTWSAAGKRVLDVPSFEIRQGEVTALIGPNGAGKSSLLKMLALLEKPDLGEIRYRDILVADKRLAIRRTMAMVFQEPLLLAGSVYKNVSQGLCYRGLDRHETDRRVRHWLEVFGIAHLEKRNQKYLSGGEAQRVSLARAMAVEPEILFLDEPFAALDQPTRQSLAEDIGRVIRSRGIAAVFVTHNAEELSLFTDRICVMHQGRLVQEGSPEDIFTRPSNRVTASLVGVENVIPGCVAGGTDPQGRQVIQVGPHRLTAAVANRLIPGTPVQLFVRPEAILPASDGNPVNSLFGVIEKTVSLGSQYKLVVECNGPWIILVSKGTHALNDVRPGRPFNFQVSPDRIHVIVAN
jgi:tungstate transport system ATP-binding protein